MHICEKIKVLPDSSVWGEDFQRFVIRLVSGFASSPYGLYYGSMCIKYNPYGVAMSNSQIAKLASVQVQPCLEAVLRDLEAPHAKCHCG